MLLDNQERNEYLSAIRKFFQNLDQNCVTAIDLETRGGDPCRDSWVVCFSIATELTALNLHFGTEGPGSSGQPLYLECLRLCHELGLEKNVRWVAHNVFFDGSYLARDLPDVNWNWYLCSYAALRWVASEGFPGQQWGLKWAQEHLLGWEETNEVALDEWLCDHGYGRRVQIRQKDADGSYQIDSEGNPITIEKLQPDKGEMWRAPPNILGHYCALDSYSTALLVTKVLEPVLSSFKALPAYVSLYQKYLPILISQRFAGIDVDLNLLSEHRKNLGNTIQSTREEFFQHPDVAKAVSFFNQQMIDEWKGKEPEKFLKKKLGAEPNRLKKDGSISANWLKWKEKEQAPLVLSKNWEKWKEKETEVETFNLASRDQLSWLLYDALEFPVLLRTEPSSRFPEGQPATDEDALLQMGQIGPMLVRHQEAVKEMSFVESLSSIQIDGVLHPQVKVPGTLTGRLSGAGGFNVQNPPKSRGLLQCLVKPKGYSLVQADFTALEMVVMAELSKDPGLWELYGPGSNDRNISEVDLIKHLTEKKIAFTLTKDGIQIHG